MVVPAIHRFCYVAFSFSFSLMYFWISLDTSLIPGLFRKMSVSFNALDHIIFLLLISSFIGVREHTLYGINSIKFVRLFYDAGWGLLWCMSNRYLKRICTLLLLGSVFCCEFFYPLWFYVKCEGRSVEVSTYNYGYVDFSLQFHQFLLHIFCSSVVWCSYI